MIHTFSITPGRRFAKLNARAGVVPLTREYILTTKLRYEKRCEKNRGAKEQR